ncbi:MAG: phosphoribosylformylglycinamidine cyclo-ligase [Planctomycetota bacterium]|nr:phosphoribosylformylglycinamidine cyclo-ligase [Planctomycetota bacterium]
MPKRLTYKSSGVSIEANDALVRRIQRSIKPTQDHRVIDAVNGFAGLFSIGRLGRNYKDAVLVGCSDGVGSKVLLAAKAGKLDTVGVDLVAMNVNDMATCGAEPLFFLDYVALNKNIPKRTAAIVAGVAKGCRLAGCALLGGETAEMPDVYRKGDFDLAGFAVGIVGRNHLITGEDIRPGDSIIGLHSSGIHSNGYSLVRKVFFEAHNYKLSSRIKGLRGLLGAELLKPTRIYIQPILELVRERRIVLGLAHITGGGLVGNVPRILPPGCQAHIRKGTWKVPPIFNIMQSLGVPESEMYRTFNMGVGMAIVARRKNSTTIIQHFKRHKIKAFVIGEIVSGKRKCRFS